MKLLLIAYTFISLLIIKIFTSSDYESLLSDGIYSVCELPKDNDSISYFLPILCFVPFLFLKRNKLFYLSLSFILIYYIWRILLRFLFC